MLETAADKLAVDPIALDLKGLASFTDCFIICSGGQRRQTQAIGDAIVDGLAAQGERPGHVEGYALGDWILIDYGDLVVHVFTRETRDFYKLERLWGDAPRVALEGPERRRDREAPAARKG